MGDLSVPSPMILMERCLGVGKARLTLFSFECFFVGIGLLVL